MLRVWAQSGKFEQRRNPTPHFSASAALAVALAVLAGCAQLPQRADSVAHAEQPLARMNLPAVNRSSRASALAIAGEFALQNDDFAGAVRDYAEAARISNDPVLAKRAFRAALAAQDAGAAAAALARWRALGGSRADLAAGRGQLELLRGDRAAAEAQFGILVASGRVADWKTFATALLAAGDSALAGRVLKDLATLSRLPVNEHLWVALSQLGEHLDQHAFASALANAAVARFHGADSILWAASLRLAAGDRASAEALYAEGVAAHPRNAELRLGYAALLRRRHEYRQAMAVLARGPQTDATWAARAALAASAKDTAALQRLYTELQHGPVTQRDANAFLLGQLAELLQHDRQAMKWYAEVNPDGDHAFYAQARSAVLLDKAGKRAEAHALAAQLQHDYADDPDRLRSACELDAQLYSHDGEHAKAIAAYDRGLAALPNDPALRYNRGVEEANAGDTDAALKDFRAVLAREPGNVDAMNALGFTLADADRDLPEATQLLRKALAARPDTPAILDSWGWLQYRLGHLDVAETYLKRAWGQQRDPDIGVHLGEVLWKLGQRQSAHAVFAQVRKLDPHNASLRRAEGALWP